VAIIMKGNLAVSIIIEREKVGKKDMFIASSSDVNVFAEGRTIDEAKKNFLEGLRSHLKAFPEEKDCLIVETKQDYETPMVAKIFL